jgi:hypothetical protein
MKNVDLGKIKEYLVLITKQFQAFGKLVEIVEVDDSVYTCTVKLIDNHDIEYYDVRLSASPTPTFVNIPTVGSVVIMNFLNENQGYISLFSEIDKQIISNSEGENLKVILDDLIEGYHNAIMNATWSHPQGATIAQPHNFAEFEQLKTDILQRIEKLLGE